MNILLIILNRIYLVLSKTKNQSPLLGSSILVSILIGISCNNIFLFIFSFKSEPLKFNNWLYYILTIFIFLIINNYSKNNEQIIINKSMFSKSRNNLLVILLFIFTMVSFILLGNINREKISKLKKHSEIQGIKKPSLEGKIRKWLED